MSLGVVRNPIAAATYRSLARIGLARAREELEQARRRAEAPPVELKAVPDE
jgi:hypothetical protein